MRSGKLTEFITVLLFAMVVGAAGILSILYLNGTAQMIAIVLIVVAMIASWRYLRKRFGRQ
jgi:4-hydroxybenzoate polyprenyltransferase